MLRAALLALVSVAALSAAFPAAPASCVLDGAHTTAQYRVPTADSGALYYFGPDQSTLHVVESTPDRRVIATTLLRGGFLEENGISVVKTAKGLELEVGGRALHDVKLRGDSARIVFDGADAYVIADRGCEVVHCQRERDAAWDASLCARHSPEFAHCEDGSVEAVFAAVAHGLVTVCTRGGRCDVAPLDGKSTGGWPHDLVLVEDRGVPAALEPETGLLLALATQPRRRARVLVALLATEHGLTELDRIVVSAQTNCLSQLFVAARAESEDRAFAVIARGDGALVRFPLERGPTGWLFSLPQAVAFHVSALERYAASELLFPYASTRWLCMAHPPTAADRAREGEDVTGVAVCVDLEALPREGCTPCAEAGLARYVLSAREVQRQSGDQLPECRHCVSGFYCPDATFAWPCPPDRPLSSDGAISVSECRACLVGEHPNFATGGCSPCPAGFVCDGKVATPCPMMQPASPPGSSSTLHCTACEPGHYYSARRGVCRVCPTGAVCTDGVFKYPCPTEMPYSRAGSSSLASCSSCPGNSHWVPSLRSCVSEEHHIVAGDGLSTSHPDAAPELVWTPTRIAVASVLGGSLLIVVLLLIWLMVSPASFYRVYPCLRPPSAVHTEISKAPYDPLPDGRVLARHGPEYILESPADPAFNPLDEGVQTAPEQPTPSTSVQCAQGCPRDTKE